MISEIPAEEDRPHFITDKKDRLFFRKEIAKSNVGQTLQTFEIQLKYLKQSDEIHRSMYSKKSADHDHTMTEMRIKSEVFDYHGLLKKFLIKFLNDISEQTMKDMNDIIQKMKFYANWYLQ